MQFKEVSARYNIWRRRQGYRQSTTLEQLGLVAGEIGEAVNECRNDVPTPALQLELADIVLRVMGIADMLDFDLEKAILTKIQINERTGNKGRTV
jgi:NTP pyrophosphatase (non-canonical NTP hydrolase)